MAKTGWNSRRELLYLLFFYIWQIKSVINVEKLRLKKIEEWDENKDINVALVGIFFRITLETE